MTPKPTEINITGIDKRQIGQIAAEIRGLPPDLSPTRARACSYAGEFIFRKEGKKK